MSFVIASPDMVASAAADLAGIRSAIGAANAAVAGPTAQIQAAASDEVSTAISTLFGEYGQAYQAVGAQAAAYHDQFVQALSGAGLAYAGTEAANAQQTLEQDLLGVINAPTETLLGRPLIGNGANGGTVNGVGQAGGAGGILYGSGGAGGNSTNLGVAGGSGGSAGLIGNGGAGAAAAVE
ncbi:PE family protein, partial [Mycobacterium heidelbergense]